MIIKTTIMKKSISTLILIVLLAACKKDNTNNIKWNGSYSGDWSNGVVIVSTTMTITETNGAYSIHLSDGIDGQTDLTGTLTPNEITINNCEFCMDAEEFHVRNGGVLKEIDGKKQLSIKGTWYDDEVTMMNFTFTEN